MRNFLLIKTTLPGILLAICALFLTPETASAQWRVGASAGADYNWYSINVNYQTDYRYDGAWGWSGAVFGQYNFMEWLGLRAELEAMERNYRFYRTGEMEQTNYITHNTYLQLPIMAQFSFGPSVFRGEKTSGLRGFVNLGVYAGYWLASKQKGTFYETLQDDVINLNDAYVFQSEKDQRADFGLAGGLGLEYRFSEHWAAHLEGRCYYSFVSTVKQYMRVKDYRYNTTLGLQAGFSYIF